MAFRVGPSGYASQQSSMFDDLLAALSRQFEIRDLFQHLTSVIRRVVPHDEARLVLLSEDGSSYRYSETPDSTSEGIAADGAPTMDDGSSRRCSMSCLDRSAACGPA